MGSSILWLMSGCYIVRGPSAGHISVEAWSAERLPFEPKGWKVQFRNDVREALRRLSFVPDAGLAASYISPIKGYCDAENILFYNVGSASFAHLRCKSICFERLFSQPPTLPDNAANGLKHYLSYTLTSIERGFTYWEHVHLPLAKWEHLPCGMLTSSSKAASIWYWFKSEISAGRVQGLIRPGVAHANLGLKVTVHVPRIIGLNLASVIKPVFDGIMAAFSSHDGSKMNLVTERLSSTLCIDQKDLVYLLSDETTALLGARKLVWPRGFGVQWNPNDDRLVANKFLLVDDVSQRGWELSGELFEVRETRSGTPL